MKGRNVQHILKRLASSAALCALIASVSTRAQAQAEDQAAARQLFEDGRRLLKNGQYSEACQKLQAASRLYASPGILLNLGDCYDKIGRTASAWTEFGEAAAAAGRVHRNDQVNEARRRQAAAEPKLTRLAIRVASPVAGLTITRDDSEVASAALGEAIPVDPGTHQVRAEAPGYESWSTSVVASTPGQTITVDVPALTATPAPPAPPPAAESTPTGSAAPAAFVDNTTARRRSHTVDWALVGGGAVVGIAGGVLWDIGATHAREANYSYTWGPHTSQQLATAKSDYNAALTPYYLGLAGVIVGGAAATAGVVLMTVGSSRARVTGAVRAVPWASTSGGGLQVAGGW
jgi:tetratricopeptide (TPR) repeat protein